jgi:transcriptional regulator with XRE-family HTH domain
MKSNNGQYLKAMGRKIQDARKAKGLTIRQFANMCGMDFSNLNRLENGQKDCHVLSLKAIAEALNMEVREFL